MPPESSENPFAPPAADSSQVPMLVSDDASDFALLDDFVVCGPLFVLPKVCWKSGSTEDLRRVQFKIDQASFVFHSRPIEVIGYISKSQRQRDLWRGIR